MAFNRRLVSYYKEDELKALLSNPSQYRRIILDKFSRKDKDCKLNDLALIDALDNYIVKMLNTTPWLLNKQELTAYRDFLYSVHNTNRSIVFDSILNYPFIVICTLNCLNCLFSFTIVYASYVNRNWLCNHGKYAYSYTKY